MKGPQDSELRREFNELGRDARKYVETRYDLFELDMGEKVAKLASGITYGVANQSILVVVIAFILLAMAFGFSLAFVPGGSDIYTLLRALSLGFLCSAGVALVILGILALSKKGIKRKVEAEIINAVIDKQEEREDERLRKEEQPIRMENPFETISDGSDYDHKRGG